jgi:hypothetical protein
VRVLQFFSLITITQSQEREREKEIEAFRWLKIIINSFIFEFMSLLKSLARRPRD